MSGNRIGIGYDVHRLGGEGPLRLGGVEIAHDRGVIAHSDGDVLIHALMDALLGAMAAGDIGQHFPDSDPAYAGASSLHLLAQVMGLVQSRGFRVVNVDATIVCEAPRLAPHLPAMRQALDAVLACGVDAIGLKATTNEGLGAIGRGESIAVHAVALLASS